MGSLCHRVSFVDIHDTALTLKEVFATGSFNANMLYTAISLELLHYLDSFQKVIFDDNTPDRLIWSDTINGDYSVRNGYQWLVGRDLVPLAVPFWHVLWKLWVPHNIQFFVWKITHNSLPTSAFLFHRHIVSSGLCRCCGVVP